MNSEIPNTADKFKDRVLHCIKKVGSGTALARAIGVTPATVGNYVRGSDPSRSILVKMAEVANVDLVWLATGKSVFVNASGAAAESVQNDPDLGLQGRKNEFSVMVEGEKMEGYIVEVKTVMLEPYLKRGEHVMIHRNSEFQGDGVYHVQSNSEESFVFLAGRFGTVLGYFTNPHGRPAHDFVFSGKRHLILGKAWFPLWGPSLRITK